MRKGLRLEQEGSQGGALLSPGEGQKDHPNADRLQGTQLTPEGRSHRPEDCGAILGNDITAPAGGGNCH